MSVGYNGYERRSGVPLVISDDVLRAADLTEREAAVEIACRLFDAEILDKYDASQLAGLTRGEFEAELLKRDLPVIRYTQEMVEQDMKWVREEQERGRTHETGRE